MKKVFKTTSHQQTEALAAKIGANLKGGETIELVSDVGGGKTTFVRGLAKGSGSKDHTSSPSFTISNQYKTPNFVIHHFDFYRLHNAGIVEHELKEKVQDTSDVVAVEWSDIVEHVLSAQRLSVRIIATTETERELTIDCAPQLDYLLKDLPQ